MENKAKGKRGKGLVITEWSSGRGKVFRLRALGESWAEMSGSEIMLLTWRTRVFGDGGSVYCSTDGPIG